jgi:hypothetical protein
MILIGATAIAKAVLHVLLIVPVQPVSAQAKPVMMVVAELAQALEIATLIPSAGMNIISTAVRMAGPMTGTFQMIALVFMCIEMVRLEAEELLLEDTQRIFLERMLIMLLEEFPAIMDFKSGFPTAGRAPHYMTETRTIYISMPLTSQTEIIPCC